MTKMIFTDGMEIDTGGDYRIIHKRDGLYVVGHSMLCPVETEAEGETLIAKLRASCCDRMP